MITIETIIKQDGDSCLIGFSARDQEGCTVLEGNIADTFKLTLSKTREAIFKTIPDAEGFDDAKSERLSYKYHRTFDNPEARDKAAELLESMKASIEKAEQLSPEMKERTDAVIEEDPEMVATIVHTAFLAGMQLAMRICRNRAKDARELSMTTTNVEMEAETCAGLIRTCQVEIGSGRMQRPQFTKEEYDEMDRIS